MSFAFCFSYREIELLKKKTAQQKTLEETEASHKEETEQLQDEVKYSCNI